MRNISLFVAVSVFISSCAGLFYTPLSPQDLEKRGTHVLTNVSPARGFNACVVALETLGYRVTLASSDSMVIKTAPKTVMTSAHGSGSSAQITEDGLAWHLNLMVQDDGLVVRAVPRGYRNGTELGQGMWVAEVMDPKFRDLWREVDDAARTMDGTVSPRQPTSP